MTRIRHRHLLTLLVTSLLTLFSLTTAQCPTSECDCTDDEKLNCRNKDLTSVPQFDDTTWTFTEVTLAGNDITALGSNAFKTASGDGLRTTTLDVTDNRITSIDDAAFAGLEANLQVLKLDVSAMTSFPTVAISTLVNLEALYLKGFNIDDIPNDALSPLTSLRNVSFEDCGITTLSNADFSSQRSTLQVLQLALNELDAVPNLDTLTALRVLDLQGNDRIRVIDNDDFEGMDTLETLDLSQMGVNTITSQAFEDVKDTLTSLSLSRNGPDLIHSDLTALQKLSQLQVLELNGNGISQIPPSQFTQMSRLQELYLQDNAITSVSENSFGGLTSALRVLNLADNNILGIQQYTFDALTGLQTLTLDDNPLGGTFNQNTFKGLNSLKTLRMENVQFRGGDDFTSIQQLSTLTTLNMESNQITDVPDNTFLQVNALTSLDVAGNQLVTLTQASLNGLQNSLTSLILNDNNIRTLPSCLLYGFQPNVDIQLSDNPLHCDCEALWLRLYIDGMTSLVQELNDWQCASPSQHAGRLLKELSRDEVCDDPDYATECEVLGPTTLSSTLPSGMSLEVQPLAMTSDSVTVNWTVTGDAQLIEKFVVDWSVKNENSGGANADASADARQHKIDDLDGGVTYVVCVTVHPSQYEARACTDASTLPVESESKDSRSILYIILSCVLALVLAALLAGVIVCVIVLVRRRRKRFPPVQTHKSMTSLNSSVPFVTDHSKRFSKPKPHTISRDFNSTASLDLDRNLEGFTAEERDRILKLFRSNMSLNSVGGPMRYVGDPTGAQGGAYTNEIPMQDEYEEIPVDQYQYIDMDAINPDLPKSPKTSTSSPTALAPTALAPSAFSSKASSPTALSPSAFSPAAPPLRQSVASRPRSYSHQRQSRPESYV